MKMKMNTKHYSRPLTMLAALSALALSVSLSAPRGEAGDDAAATNVRFSGLRHTALGSALLHERLVLSNIGATGDDGVSIGTRRSRRWTASRLRVVPSSLDWSLNLSASGVRGGQRVQPSLQIQEKKDQARDRYLVSLAPSFGPSTYRVEIYDGSALVYELSGLTGSGEPVASGNDPICDALGKSNSVALGVCEWVVRADFQQNDSFECEFGLRGPRKEFFLPDGSQVLGTEIRFIENLSAAPQEAVFRRIHLRGSDIRTLELDAESVERR